MKTKGNVCLVNGQAKIILEKYSIHFRGAGGAMAIIVGNEHGDPRSNPGLGCLHFVYQSWEMHESNYSSSSYG